MISASDPLGWLAWAAVVGLGGWRLASLLVAEEGPFEIFARLRGWFDPAPGEPYGYIAKMLLCVWCTSIYTTCFVAALWQVHPIMAALPAAWGAAILVESSARRS